MIILVKLSAEPLKISVRSIVEFSVSFFVGLATRKIRAFKLGSSQVGFGYRHLGKVSFKNIDFSQMNCFTFQIQKPLAKEGKDYVRDYVTLESIRND